MDDDGLLSAGEPGVQLTWMDAKVGDWVVTPRIGKPVEVQALWLNALWIASQFVPEKWQAVLDRGIASFRTRFWNEQLGCLYDVVDVDHEHGRVDATIRPNQIFAIGGLPFRVLDGHRAAQVLACARSRPPIPPFARATRAASSNAMAPTIKAPCGRG
jgi:predicted glycogen debranching enzyme